VKHLHPDGREQPDVERAEHVLDNEQADDERGKFAIVPRAAAARRASAAR
jgi:hypothetical protein